MGRSHKRKTAFIAFLLLASLLGLTVVPSAKASPSEVLMVQQDSYNIGVSLDRNHPSSDDYLSGIGNSFQVPSDQDYNITKITLYLGKYGSPTGNASVKIYAHTGVYGSSSLPTGSAFATSDPFDVSTITSGYNQYNVTFNASQQYQMTHDGYYVWAWENPSSGIDSDNYVKVCRQSSTDPYSGSSCRYRNSAWEVIGANPGRDVAFRIYAEEQPVYGDPEYSQVRMNCTRAGNSSTLFINWTCTGHTLSGFQIEHNNTGVMANYTWTEMTGSQNRSEYTFTLNSTVDTTIQLREHCNDSNNDLTTTDWYYFTTTEASSSLLYLDGRDLKQVSDNQTIYLEGANHGRGCDAPTGYWHAEGEMPGANTAWSETRVKDVLHAMQCLNMNTLRYLICIDWWWKNTTAGYGAIYRGYIKDLANWTGEYGIYLIPVPYATTSYPAVRPNVPYPPAHDGSVISDEDEFIDFIENMTLELKQFSNVIFEFWNEPHGAAYKSGWMNVTQYCIDRVRRHSDAPIFVQWGFHANPSEPLDSWVDDYTLYGTNIIYSTHQYRYHGSFGTEPFDERPYTYEDVKEASQVNKIDWVGDTMNKHLVIGEFGDNLWLDPPDYNQTRERLAVENQIRIYKEWGISYLIWVFRGSGTQWDILTNEMCVQRPNSVGRAYMSRHFGRPVTIACGNESVSGYAIDPYYYTRNIAYEETWTTGNLTVNITGTGNGTLRVFWPVWNPDTSDFWDVNITMKFGNGTEYNALDFYDSTHGLISVSFVGPTIIMFYYAGAPQNIVVLNTPLAGATETSLAVNFTFTPTFYQTIQNASVWTNEGGWSAKAWNITEITNGTQNTINLTFSSEGVKIWNVQVFNLTHGIFATTNRTLTISLEAETIVLYVLVLNETGLGIGNSNVTVAKSLTYWELTNSTGWSTFNDSIIVAGEWRVASGQDDLNPINVTYVSGIMFVIFDPQKIEGEAEAPTVSSELVSSTMLAASMMGLVFIAAMAYSVTSNRDPKWAILFAVVGVLMLIVVLALSQMPVLGG